MTSQYLDGKTGGPCRRKTVSTQQDSNKRKCAACIMCAQQFVQGKLRLLQWSYRDSQCAYVHTQCIKGGIGLDHELRPRPLSDQEAVNQVTTLRDSSHIAAASQEVIMLVESDFERYTAALADDDVRFSREDALRLVDEIMNFQWFAMVALDTIRDLRGTSFVWPSPVSLSSPLPSPSPSPPLPSPLPPHTHTHTPTNHSPTRFKIRPPISTTCHPTCHRQSWHRHSCRRTSIDCAVAQQVASAWQARHGRVRQRLRSLLRSQTRPLLV